MPNNCFSLGLVFSSLHLIPFAVAFWTELPPCPLMSANAMVRMLLH